MSTIAERPETQEAPSTHLGMKWEIVLVTVFVVVFLVIFGTLWFHIRRKRLRGRVDMTEPAARFESRSSTREKGDGVYRGLATPDPIADPPRLKYTRSLAPSPTSDSSYHERERSSHKPPMPRYYWDQR